MTEYIQRYCEQQSLTAPDFMELLVEKLTADPFTIWKTAGVIIGHYQRYTKNRWNRRDDLEAVQFNATDGRIVELGIIKTVIHHWGRKLGSFSECVPEIRAAQRRFPRIR
jgi:hypothetical protein